MSSSPSSARRALITAATFLAVSGFFVAKVPDATRPEHTFVSNLFVLALAFPSFIAFLRWVGAGKFLLAFLLLSTFAITIESLGVLTGWPYGEFAHHNEIGWKLFGLVPWTVPFAWIPLVLGAAALASRFSMAQWRLILLTACIMVAVDGVLDPGAVHQDFWSYKHPGVYYGVPASNFLGWFISGSIGAALLVLSCGRAAQEAWPASMATSVFLILVFWTSVCLFAGLWIPGFLGGVLLYVFGRLLFSTEHATTATP